MGYETKLIVVNRYVFGDYIWAEIIATFDLCKLPWSFNHHDVFKEPIDFDLYLDEGTVIREDSYGDLCCMANIDDVIDAINKLAEKENYRRYKPCLELLRGFDQSQWGDLRVVHWGH